MSYLNWAYKLGAAYALEQFKQAASGIPPIAPAPASDPHARVPNEGAQAMGPNFVGKRADFFGGFLGKGDDNPTDPPRKTAADIAVEAALEKLSEPQKQRASRPLAGKGTRFKALKARLKRKKSTRNMAKHSEDSSGIQPLPVAAGVGGAVLGGAAGSRIGRAVVDNSAFNAVTKHVGLRQELGRLGRLLLHPRAPLAGKLLGGGLGAVGGGLGLYELTKR